MNYETYRTKILDYFPFEPTADQLDAIEHFAEYMLDAHPYGVFVLQGYAGTGKTALLRALTQATEQLGTPVELMATTGRAAKVLQEATQHHATTIHRRIYRAGSQPIEQGGGYELGKGNARPCLFIVDEASMIAQGNGEPSPFGSGDLLDDLLSYTQYTQGSKLLLVGDIAQLPPVGSDLSPALSTDILEGRYGLQVWQAELTEVVRQQESSEILRCATKLRELLETYEDYPQGEAIPLKLKLHAGREIEGITGSELVEQLQSAYHHYGEEEVLVVSPSNKRALLFNQGIRAQVFDYEEEINRGERLIVARNNYFYAQRRDHADFIANGEIIELDRIIRYHEMYGLRFADAEIYLPDRDQELEARLLLTGLTDQQAQRTHQQRLALYNALTTDYLEGAGVSDTRSAIKRDAYWGALEVKYGYAVTAHKAQGGQWRCVFIDLGIMHLLPQDRNMVRWLYTALTRATEQVYLVNPPEGLIEFLRPKRR